MAVNVSREANALPNAQSGASHRRVNEAIVDAIEDLAQALDTLAAKLNADGGVTDTDYSIVNEAAVDAVIEKA